METILEQNIGNWNKHELEVFRKRQKESIWNDIKHAEKRAADKESIGVIVAREKERHKNSKNTPTFRALTMPAADCRMEILLVEALLAEIPDMEITIVCVERDPVIYPLMLTMCMLLSKLYPTVSFEPAPRACSLLEYANEYIADPLNRGIKFDLIYCDFEGQWCKPNAEVLQLSVQRKLIRNGGYYMATTQGKRDTPDWKADRWKARLKLPSREVERICSVRLPENPSQAIANPEGQLMTFPTVIWDTAKEAGATLDVLRAIAYRSGFTRSDTGNRTNTPMLQLLAVVNYDK